MSPPGPPGIRRPAQYEGEWQFDKKDGNGTLTEADACYEGEWRSGDKHGKGKVTFARGDEYEGDYAFAGWCDRG